MRQCLVLSTYTPQPSHSEQTQTLPPSCQQAPPSSLTPRPLTRHSLDATWPGACPLIPPLLLLQPLTSPLDWAPWLSFRWYHGVMQLTNSLSVLLTRRWACWEHRLSFFYSGPTGHSVNTCWVNEEAKQQRTCWESECDVCVLLCASTWKILMMIFCIWLYLDCTDVNILFMLLYYNFAIDVTIGGNWVKHSETSLYFFL